MQPPLSSRYVFISQAQGLYNSFLSVWKVVDIKNVGWSQCMLCSIERTTRLVSFVHLFKIVKLSSHNIVEKPVAAIYPKARITIYFNLVIFQYTVRNLVCLVKVYFAQSYGLASVRKNGGE